MTHLDLFDGNGCYLGRKKAKLLAEDGEGTSKVYSLDQITQETYEQLDLEEFPLDEDDCALMTTLM